MWQVAQSESQTSPSEYRWGRFRNTEQKQVVLLTQPPMTKPTNVSRASLTTHMFLERIEMFLCERFLLLFEVAGYAPDHPCQRYVNLRKERAVSLHCSSFPMEEYWSFLNCIPFPPCAFNFPFKQRQTWNYGSLMTHTQLRVLMTRQSAVSTSVSSCSCKRDHRKRSRRL